VRADRAGCVPTDDGSYREGKECPVDHYCYQGKSYRCRPGFSTKDGTGQGNCAYVKPGYYYSDNKAAKCPKGAYSEGFRPRDADTSCIAWCEVWGW